MSKLLQVGNDIFEYPQQGTGQGHGEDATSWAEAVTAALADFLGPNDILITSQTLANGGTGTISELSFNLAQVQHVNVEYLIIRQYLRRVTGVDATATFANRLIDVDSSSIDTATNEINFVNHNLVDGQVVRVVRTLNDLPSPLLEDTSYKVVTVDSDNFKLTDLADVEIDLTTNPVGTFNLQKQSLDTESNHITAVNHKLTTGQVVRVIVEDAGSLPAPLAADTDYKVVVIDENTLKLTNLADVDIDLLAVGTGTFSIQERVEDTIVESGKIYGNYNGSDFRISLESVGDDSGVDIDVNTSGAFSYVTSNLPDQSLGQIYFKAKTIDQ